MNSGDAYIRVPEDLPRLAKEERAISPRSHSFTPLLSTFAGDQWRIASEGIFTHVWPSGESPSGETGFTLRISVHPAIADDVLRGAVPLIVRAGCPFKVIANTALLELVGARCSSEESTADFITIFPLSEKLFNDLIFQLKAATGEITLSDIPAPPAEPRGRTELTPENPWPGLEPFLPGECAYFCGRAEEHFELAERIERGVVTVVLGQAAVGKTSLLRAGLKPTFDRLRFEPVYLRLQRDGPASPVQQVRDEMNRVLAQRQIDGPPFGEGQTLGNYFHSQTSGWVAADRKPVVPVLIFDHFEDVLTFDGAGPAARDQVEALWTQIAALIDNRVPETPGQINLPYVSPSRRNLFKVVISLRQDHLPALLARRGKVPSIDGNHFLLQPFNGPKAIEAVLGPGRRLFDPAHPDALAEQIVRRLGRETPPSDAGGGDKSLDGVRVEPALLSFFCQQLNEARKRSPEGGPAAGLITGKLVDAEAERILEDFFKRTGRARCAAPPPQVTGQGEPRKSREEILPAPNTEPPPKPPLPVDAVAKPPSKPPLPVEAVAKPPSKPPLPVEAGNHGTGRLKYLIFALCMLLIIFLPVLLVTHFENLQRQLTEVELEQFILNLAAARTTVDSANKKLTLAESNLALKESNILGLAEQTREKERQTLETKEENSTLAGRQTNLQSQITLLDRQKTHAEFQLTQWSNMLYNLTNQIANLGRQMNALEARNNALAAASDATILSGNWLGTSNFTEEKALAAMESFPEKLPGADDTDDPAMPDAEAPSPRDVRVLLTHGECLYSEIGGTFRPLHLHHSLFEGAIVRTGEKSWTDLFFRRTGTTIRLAPDSEIKIARLSVASPNGVPLTDALLELHNGRLFSVVRALMPGSTLEISDATGHSVIEGGGLGCYMIAAPGPGSSDKLSVTPLRVVTVKGHSAIVPGQKYSAKDGTSFSLVSSRWENMLIQLDELEDETDKALAEPETPDLPRKN